MSQPLVSCICVTYHQSEILSRAIRCFQEQTYSNRELIVGFTSSNKDAMVLLEEFNDPSIKAVLIPDHISTLGEKRNWTIEHSSGFYFCVWDDDDWYSNTRIARQVRSIRGTPFKSTALSSIILFDSNSNEVYRSAIRTAWEQTLLCERSIFKTPSMRYDLLDRGEDSRLVYNLKKNNLLLTTHNPALYIYVFHGKNTWHRQHWEENLIRWATKLDESRSALVRKILQADTFDSASAKALELELKIQ